MFTDYNMIAQMEVIGSGSKVNLSVLSVIMSWLST